MASEDMDSLTFGAPRFLRRLTMPDARKMPVLEIHLDRVLKGMSVTMDQFIDVCILSGCDYCDTIRGVGPKKALAGVKKWNTLERFVRSLDRKKYKTPASVGGTVDGFVDEVEKVRKLFKTPVVRRPTPLPTPGACVLLLPNLECGGGLRLTRGALPQRGVSWKAGVDARCHLWMRGCGEALVGRGPFSVHRLTRAIPSPFGVCWCCCNRRLPTARSWTSNSRSLTSKASCRCAVGHGPWAGPRRFVRHSVWLQLLAGRRVCGSAG